jgi:hypothetical protein
MAHIASVTDRRGRSLPRVVAATLLALAASGWQASVMAQNSYEDSVFQNDAEPDAPRSVRPGRKWQEDLVTLPPWPKDGNLIEVKLDGPEQALTYHIDKRSLATGADGVVRYTLVAESQTGARNLSFEGIRCTPKGRWRTYAYGIDGRFSESGVSDQWNEIQSAGATGPHYDLWRHYLCVDRAFEPRPRKDQLRMLKSGRVPRVENAGFLAD